MSSPVVSATFWVDVANYVVAEFNEEHGSVVLPFITSNRNKSTLGHQMYTEGLRTFKTWSRLFVSACPKTPRVQTRWNWIRIESVDFFKMFFKRNFPWKKFTTLQKSSFRQVTTVAPFKNAIPLNDDFFKSHLPSYFNLTETERVAFIPFMDAARDAVYGKMSEFDDAEEFIPTNKSARRFTGVKRVDYLRSFVFHLEKAVESIVRDRLPDVNYVYDRNISWESTSNDVYINDDEDNVFA